MSRHRRNISYSRSLSRRRSWSRNSRSRSRSPSIYSDKHGSDRYSNDRHYKQDSYNESNNWDSTSDYKMYYTNNRRKEGSKAKSWGRVNNARRYIDNRQFIIIKDLPKSLMDRDELDRILSKQVKPNDFTINEGDKSVLVDYGSSDKALSAYKDLSHRLSGCKITRISMEDEKSNHSNKYESDDFQERSNKLASLESKKRVLIEKYSTQLKELVSNLSNTTGDERNGLVEQIHKLKSRIKTLSTPPVSKVQKFQNSIDNRSSTLIFESIPDCAQGPGKLAKWISDNSLLQGSQIVSLKKQDQSVLITYNNASIANMVKNACALHGIQSKFHE